MFKIKKPEKKNRGRRGRMEFCTEFSLCSCPHSPYSLQPPYFLHFAPVYIPVISPIPPFLCTRCSTDVPSTSPTTSPQHSHAPPTSPAGPLFIPRSRPKFYVPPSPSTPTSDALICHSNPSLPFAPLIHASHPVPISAPHIPGTPSHCNPSAVSDETSHGYHT